MFTNKGLITVPKSSATEDKITEIVLEAGAEDLSDQGESWEVLYGPQDFEAVPDAIKAAGLAAETLRGHHDRLDLQKLEGTQANAMIRLLETFEDLDDTQNVYTELRHGRGSGRR